MDTNNEVDMRIRSRLLGVSITSKRQFNICSDDVAKKIIEWAITGSSLMQGSLVGESGKTLAKILAEKFNHNIDEYDTAIDAVYNAGQGSSSALHHLLDGQHSMWGAFQSIQDVSQDDSFLTEIMQSVEHLVRDLCSVSGINPTFSLTKESFDQLASSLAPLGISKMYLADALTVNGPELIGGTLGILAILLGGRSKSSIDFSELTGSLVLAGFASANPILLPIAGYSMYKCLKSRNDTSWSDICLSTGKGALVTGTVFTVSAAIGGPVWIGLTCGLAAAIGVKYNLGKMGKIYDKLTPSYQAVSNSYSSICKNVVLAYENTQ